MRTIDLACTGSAYCPKNASGTNYHGAASYNLAGAGVNPYYSYLLLKFADLADADKYYSILSAQYFITCARNMPGASDSAYVVFRALRESFDETSVTYDTMPREIAGWYGGTVVQYGTTELSVSYTARHYPQSEESKAAIEALTSRAVGIYCTDIMSGSEYLSAYTEQAAAAKRPFLRITMTDTPASVVVTKHNPGENDWDVFNRGEDAVFSWDIAFVGEGGVGFIRPLADIVQTSATFYWREVGAANWNTIAVSGDVRSVTVPANTFPGRNIEWRVAPVVVGFTVIGDTSIKTAYPRIFSDAAATGLAGVVASDPDETLAWAEPFTLTTIEHFIGPDYYKNLLAEFAGLPSEYRYKAIQSAGISLKSVVGAEKKDWLSLFSLEDGFDERSVTWNTKPAMGSGRGSVTCDNTESDRSVTFYPYVLLNYNDDGAADSSIKTLSRSGRNCLITPAFMLQAYPWETRTDLLLSQGSFGVWAPVVRRAILIDQTVTSKPAAVTAAAGYINPHIAQVFRWEHVPDGEYFCLAGWSTVSATLFWSSDDGATWNSVAAAANSQSVTLPADTLPEGTILWKVTATDDQGTTASSEVYTITTVDAETTATPIAPSGTIEDGSKPITFTWSTANDYGTSQGGATLEYSTDGTTWTTFATITGSATSYDAPAGTFSAGTVYWRVTASNVDGVAGPTSDPLVFVCMAAPPAPVVSADDVPFVTISWQSETQQAYRVRIDGVLYGPFFGTGKTFTVSAYLENGGHTAEVEVQNSFGLWSDPGTVTFTVTNVPGNPITLRGSFGRDAVLNWETESAAADFYVYRDGIRIGHTAGTGFTDRFVLGEHAYFVINRLPGGYYAKSNTVAGTMRSCVSAIALLEGGDWMELKLSENSETVQSFSYSRTASLRHVLGAELPVIETSPFRDGSASYDVSFAELSQAQRFESYRGALVIVKSRGGNVVIGFVSGMSKRMTDFFIAYNFSVTRIHWEDYIDETGT